MALGKCGECVNLDRGDEILRCELTGDEVTEQTQCKKFQKINRRYLNADYSAGEPDRVAQVTDA